MIVAIDFDGTCVTHEYPNIGRSIGAEPVLAEIVKHGHKLILFNMRHGKELDDAINWFANLNIPLYGANVNPDQHTWTSSPKVHADLYIDDRSLGIPLRRTPGARPYVDWCEVSLMLFPDQYDIQPQ